MFRRHSLQVSMVKAPKNAQTENDPIVEKDWNDIADVATRFVRDGALIVGGLYVATRGFKTICNIAEEIVKANLR